MRKLTRYTALSLDRFIARRNGKIDWFNLPDPPQDEDFGYDAFFETIDTTLSGTTTYELGASDYVYESEVRFHRCRRGVDFVRVCSA